MLGRQLACVRFVRNLLNLSAANSVELASGANYPMIDMMRDEIAIETMGDPLPWALPLFGLGLILDKG